MSSTNADSRPGSTFSRCGRLLVVVAAFSATLYAAPQAPADEVGALLPAYAAHNFGRVEDSLGRIPRFDRVKEDLSRAAARAHSASDIETVAALSLEAANAAFSNAVDEKSNQIARELVEVGCNAVRRLAVGTEFERAWQLAAIALLEGDGVVGDMVTTPLQKHLDHIDGRIEAGVLALSRAVQLEQRVGYGWYRIVPGLTPQQRSQDPAAQREMVREQNKIADAARLMEVAARFPSVHVEAVVRLGFLATLRDAGPSSPNLSEVDQDTDDPTLRYWSHLFQARVSELRGNWHLSAEEYRRAYEIVPTQSAAIGLAASLSMLGDRQGASQAITEMLSHSLPDDPWWLYFSGGYRNWPLRIRALREAIH